MEDLEKQFITSSNTTLVKEAKKLCEDILVMIGEKEEMLKRKAEVFADYFLNHKPYGVETTELQKRCVKYRDDVCNFENYKRSFKENRKFLNERLMSLERNSTQISLGGMRIKQI